MERDDESGIRDGVDLSIVIPAYRQGARIRQDIAGVQAVLASLTPSHELIVVVDGSDDDSLAHALACEADQIRIFGYEVNRGKGYAVRFGFRQASGKIIGFIDAGGDIDPVGLVAAVQTLHETGSDVVVGSKRHQASRVVYPPIRRVYSAVFQLLVRLLFGFSVSDTQTGLKVFRRVAIIEALPHMSIDRFAFDVELLAIIRRVGFRKFAESPVDVNLIFPSSIGGFRPILRMFVDTIATAVRVRRIRRGSDGTPGAREDHDTRDPHEARRTRVHTGSVDTSSD